MHPCMQMHPWCSHNRIVSADVLRSITNTLAQHLHADRSCTWAKHDALCRHLAPSNIAGCSDSATIRTTDRIAAHAVFHTALPQPLTIRHSQRRATINCFHHVHCRPLAVTPAHQALAAFSKKTPTGTAGEYLDALLCAVQRLSCMGTSM